MPKKFLKLFLLKKISLGIPTLKQGVLMLWEIFVVRNNSGPSDLPF